MDISKALPGSITLEYQDEEWNQTIDYEHIPFRCRKCHEHGHLFRDCPLNASAPKQAEVKQKDGFTSVTGRRKNPTKKQNQSSAARTPSKNSFEALNQLQKEVELQIPPKPQRKGKVKALRFHTQLIQRQALSQHIQAGTRTPTCLLTRRIWQR
jgi:hypothetical protein